MSTNVAVVTLDAPVPVGTKNSRAFATMAGFHIEPCVFDDASKA